MGVRFVHDLHDLAADAARIAKTTKPRFAKAVRTNVTEAEAQVIAFAQAESGPHGLHYFERVSSEMTGGLVGEAGPEGEVAGNAVGAGWRHGAGNTDVPRTADVIGPQFAGDVDDILDGLFW